VPRLAGSRSISLQLNYNQPPKQTLKQTHHQTNPQQQKQRNQK